MALIALGAAAVSVTSACSSSSQSGPPATVQSSHTAAGAWRGDRLGNAITLSAADLHDSFKSSQGGTQTLGRLQQGHLLLLYFGYTHCPDVCPTTMADLGTALRQLPSVIQVHTQVVFVTSDPDRDSPAVMKAWLSNFDPSLPAPFVGLTASIKQIDAVAKSVGVPLEPPVKLKDGSITVQHGAQTLAFVNNSAHIVWLAGTSPGDYAHDITRLASSVGSS